MLIVADFMFKKCKHTHIHHSHSHWSKSMAADCELFSLNVRAVFKTEYKLLKLY